MKAVIRLDVPEWQIGQGVTVFFADTMCKTGVCEADDSVTPDIKQAGSEGLHFCCGYCGAILWKQRDTASLEYNKREFLFCHHCGRPVKTNDT